MNKFLYSLLYVWMYCHALLPLPILYVLADILYVPMYYLARYRRRVVRRNLENAFPDKTKKEVIAIEKAFYRNFCDYWVETMKLLHISDREMKKRMVFKNMEYLNQVHREGHSVLMYLGHFGNWEWIPSITLWMDEDVTAAQIYRPLRSQVFDRLFLNLRKRFGSVGIAKEDTLRAIVRMKREGRKLVIGFMSDQTPSPRNIHYWSSFMSQDTAVFTGVERIAKRAGFYVFYLDVSRKKRGYYEVEPRLISIDPKQTEEFEITEKYIRMMETTIRRNPAYWLWSHNRWKFKREADGSVSWNTFENDPG